MRRVSKTQVQEFLTVAKAAPFVFSEWDCAMTIANWARAAGGIDPAPHLRGAYDSVRGWERIVLAAGGLVPLVDQLLLAVDMVRVTSPIRGDCGVIERPIGCAGAIRAFGAWAVKLPTGLALIRDKDTKTIAAWGWR